MVDGKFLDGKSGWKVWMESFSMESLDGKFGWKVCFFDVHNFLMVHNLLIEFGTCYKNPITSVRVLIPVLVVWRRHPALSTLRATVDSLH